MKYTSTMTDQVFNRHNLQLAESFINDDAPTVALYTDPNDLIFLQPCTATKTE